MANTAVKLAQASIYNGPDQVSSAMLAEVEKFSKLYTDLSTELAAATGDRDKAVQTWVESSTDPEAVKLREVIAKANAKLNELANANVQEVNLTEEQLATKRTELAELKKSVRDKRTATQLVANATNIDTEGVLKALEAFEDVTRGKGGVKAGTPGPKGPRVSATVRVTGFGPDNDQTQTFDGLSKAAAAIGVETKVVQEAYAKAASVPFDNIAKVSKPLSFVVTSAGDKAFTFNTTPKPRSNAVKATAPAETATPVTEAPAEQAA